MTSLAPNISRQNLHPNYTQLSPGLSLQTVKCGRARKLICSIYPRAHPDQMRHKASLSSHQADSSRQVKRDSIEPINKIYGLLVLDRSVQLAEPAVNCSGS